MKKGERGGALETQWRINNHQGKNCLSILSRQRITRERQVNRNKIREEKQAKEKELIRARDKTRLNIGSAFQK